jgi:hypothetical protein
MPPDPKYAKGDWLMFHWQGQTVIGVVLATPQWQPGMHIGYVYTTTAGVTNQERVLEARMGGG